MTDSTITTDPFIWTKDNVLSSDFCNEIITRFEQSDSPYKLQGRAGYSVNAQIKESLDLFISDKEEWKDVDNVLVETLYQGITEYIYSLNQTLNLAKFNSAAVRVYILSRWPSLLSIRRMSSILYPL